ncbi:dienelactone hydrolase family protein [Flavobacterium sp. AS60]|uniref:dienelactone hydrolase family protein n=1 Tax=Flavobacterium anseongense TaxID=2910677 RepID=UPI001F2E8A96|nr:dienelactone hydrolase family protein [Flavobacterium sp. AS60]MCF6129448.1 dienelactone hydrolase family protein [Flavobacterium sp. AS60]
MKSKIAYIVFFGLIISKSIAQPKAVEYKDGNQVLSGLSIVPAKQLKNKPGVLILPAWMGIQNHEKEVAYKLADLGYQSFIADIYGVDQRPTNTKEAGAKAGYFKKNIKEYQTRIQLALEQLVNQGANPDDIVVIGYCFGGTGAIEAARVNMKVKGIVSFHGGLGRDNTRTIDTINPKVLVLHGADDFFVPKEEVDKFQDEMRTAKADWQMVYYANSVHSFTHKDAGNDNSKGAAYNEKADKRSWEAMLTFLKEVL